MKQLRHLSHTAQQGGQIQADDQQVTAIFDLIAQALHKRDTLGLAKYDDLAYETDVLWLLQHLPAAANRNDVAELLKERFAEQQGSPPCDPDDVLLMKALAEDIWHAWSQYLQRHDTATFSQAHSRARMRRLYYPMGNSR